MRPVRRPAAGSTSRLSPRNWRVPTRLNAILLIPVLVGLVMGGFQVKASIDTWNEAQDAEKTALIVRAASEYGQALLNERDLTAAPLLQRRTDERPGRHQGVRAPPTTPRRSSTQAVQDMPEKQGLERRLSLFRGGGAQLAELRKDRVHRGIELSPAVQTEEGYVKVQHSLMEFSNELGLGTGNITSYGRTVYAIQLAKAAESLQRSIGTHLLVRPSAGRRRSARASSIAFNSYNYLEQIALGEYVSGGTAGRRGQRSRQIMAAKAAEGRASRPKAARPRRRRAAGTDGSVLDRHGRARSASGSSPKQLKRPRASRPETWMAAATAKFDGYTEIENDLVDKAVTEAAADLRRRQAATPSSTAPSWWSPCSPPSSWPA